MSTEPRTTDNEPTTEAGRDSFCWRCGHDSHDDRNDPRCPAIVGGGGSIDPEPEYCECVDVNRLLARAAIAELRLENCHREAAERASRGRDDE